MISVTKSVLAFSALASIGLVTAYTTLSPVDVEASPSAAMSVRFPQPADMLVAPAKGDAQVFVTHGLRRQTERLGASEQCRAQQWPYIKSECLVSANGSPVRVSRIVSVERRASSDAAVIRR